MEWEEALQKREQAAELILSEFAVSYGSGIYSLPGVGVGKAEDTGRMKLVFYLANETEKSTIDHIVKNLGDTTPADIDIRVTGCAYALPASAKDNGMISPSRQRLRPVTKGSAISRNEDSAETGTLGCFVKKRGSSCDLFILSCTHVLANYGKGQIGDVIIQPSRIDGGDSNQDQIATLSEFTPLIFEDEDNNHQTPLDAAIAKVNCTETIQNQQQTNGRLLVKRYYTKEKLISTFQEKGKIQLTKSGARTQTTSGYIASINVGKDISYCLLSQDPANPFHHLKCHYEDLITIQSEIKEKQFSKKGDSGSLIYDQDGVAVGLLIGGSADKTITFALPIETVLNRLEIELL